jgi:hypothetical protein
MTVRATVITTVLCAIAAAWLSLGCAGRPSLFPNRDEALRKTSAEFAADAAKRFPYPAGASRAGEATARVEVAYGQDKFDIVNLSDADWADVEVWVNQGYVVAIPKMLRGDLKTLPFKMFFNAEGATFPTDSSKTKVTKVEVLVDGKMYDVPLRLEY